MKNKIFILILCVLISGCATGKLVMFNELPLSLPYTEKEYNSIWYVNTEFYAGNYRLKPKDAADLWKYYLKYPNSDFAKFLQEKTRWRISENSISLDTKLPYGIIPKGNSINYSKYRIEESNVLNNDIITIKEATRNGVSLYQFINGELISKNKKNW